MRKQTDDKLTACFQVKTAWHAIFRMYNQLGLGKSINSSTGFLLLNVPKNGVAVTHLGPTLGLSSRSLSRSLNNLEEKGWIERRADPQDKRMVRVFLTPLGLRCRKEASQTVKAFHRFLQSKWSPEQWELLQNMLKQMPELTTVFWAEHAPSHQNILPSKSATYELSLEN
ncbi:MAG: MarR family winged helix-turn-helix transcriptional regulator [Bacteroidia bacterium]|jgi:DNA-binding MarR family transcriptional regulator